MTTYAPEASAVCFPKKDIGGIITLDEDLKPSSKEDFQRAVAEGLSSEPEHVVVYAIRPGSTIVYFSINDQDDDDFMDDRSEVRGLTGNEKMLLMYQWWLTGDERLLEAFPEDILDFKIYMATSTTTDDSSKTTVVNTLFAPTSPTPSYILPPQPILRSSAFEHIPGFEQSQTTLAIKVTVDSAGELSSMKFVTALVVMVSMILTLI